MPYFTTTDSTRLFYQDWGEGRPTVFVSTWAMSSDVWENQVPVLTQHGLRCVTYDRRGTCRPGGRPAGKSSPEATGTLRFQLIKPTLPA
jgi:pimeloyl-ACP methyl ester carboxylesterase